METIVNSQFTHRRRPALWLASLCAMFALTLGLAPDAFAQGQCESPNLLIVLDQSCSMGFTGASYVTTSRSCGSNSNCRPMSRQFQPSPGTTPRYSSACSGSRCQYTRWDVAQNAIKEIVYRYGGTAPAYNNRTIRFGLEFFSNNGNVAAGIVSNPPTIASVLNSNGASGGTYYGNAFTTARAHLQTTVNNDSVKRRPTHILFITDGDPSDGCAAATSIATDLFNGTGANRLQDNQGNIYKVKTYVIGFGSGLSANGQACLNQIAAAGGTQRCNPSVSGCVAYFRADNDVELTNAMTSIVNNATQEVCDGLDNDCDGQTDETLTQPCTTACGTGTQTCSNGNWGACSSGTPTAETCNNRDDDCDGQTDEDFTNKGRPCTVGQGACRRSGTFVCRANGSGTQCSVSPGTPTGERCDGIDNDCDGSVDENWPTKGNSCAVGQGLCRRTGTLVCQSNGSGLRCSANAGTPVAEKCDGLDNDCDGQVDENWPTKGNSCTVGQGECRRSGTLVCQSNGSGLRCNATPGTPGQEICDGGKDNDCDGQVDEGCNCVNGRTQACFSGTQGCTKSGSSYNCTAPCRAGTQTCVNGNWAQCTGERTPVAEKCDGADNDCDGQIDEIWNNLGNNCSVGVGGCRRTGKWRCRSNQTGVECSVKAGTPKAETCNNKDDDCDGSVDETLTRACSTPCNSGTETCSAGSWRNCTATKPVPEKCNGLDDDCDGQTDETWANKGKNCSVGVGACKNTGKWQCKSDNSGVECSVTPKPASKELCDGIDNDCDGQTDEDFSKLGNSCKAGVGACENSGKIECRKDGSGTQCSATAGAPKPETCNGVDDNCDGTVDKIKRACKTACGSGSEECVNGTWQACDAPKPEQEKCNNLDDDCDGTVDGHKQKCTSKCGDGQETCVAGKWVFCDAQKPEKEDCDGIDNDCNGQVDELKPKPCAAACGKGTAVCKNGAWQGCDGPSPKPEVCDGKDNDCDGQIDNGLVRTCKGACGEGKELCRNGKFGECNAPQGDPEICDGQDNDCDGVADNGAKCPVGTQCIEGKCRLKCRNGECPGGAVCANDGNCEGDLCAKVKCPSGQKCLAGRCSKPCDLITCPKGTVCDAGKCVKDDCYRNGCPGKQRCVRGVCESDPCLGVSCGSDQFCRDGICVDSCANVKCKSDERCIDGDCKKDPTKTGPCKDVTCPTGERCVQGKCEGDPCKDVKCPNGRRCVEGVCDHDPCNDINCPSGEMCVNGQCVEDPNPKPDGGNGNPDGNNNQDGGTNPDGNNGGDGSGNNGGDGSGNNGGDGSGNNGDGSGNNGGDGSGNGTNNTDGAGGESITGGQNHDNAAGEGSRYVPGCGCSQSQDKLPLTPFLLLFFVLFSVWQHRKRAQQ